MSVEIGDAALYLRWSIERIIAFTETTVVEPTWPSDKRGKSAPIIAWKNPKWRSSRAQKLRRDFDKKRNQFRDAIKPSALSPKSCELLQSVCTHLDLAVTALLEWPKEIETPRSRREFQRLSNGGGWARDRVTALVQALQPVIDLLRQMSKAEPTRKAPCDRLIQLLDEIRAFVFGSYVEPERHLESLRTAGSQATVSFAGIHAFDGQRDELWQECEKRLAEFRQAARRAGLTASDILQRSTPISESFKRLLDWHVTLREQFQSQFDLGLVSEPAGEPAWEHIGRLKNAVFAAEKSLYELREIVDDCDNKASTSMNKGAANESSYLDLRFDPDNHTVTRKGEQFVGIVAELPAPVCWPVFKAAFEMKGERLTPRQLAKLPGSKVEGTRRKLRNEINGKILALRIEITKHWELVEISELVLTKT